jgi:hypothetical protein
MLSVAKLPHTFWAEALPTAAYLRNRSPTKAVKEMTPYEAWKGEKPAVDHLRALDTKSMCMYQRMKERSSTRSQKGEFCWGMEQKQKVIGCTISRNRRFFSAQMLSSMNMSVGLRRSPTNPKTNDTWNWNPMMNK